MAIEVLREFAGGGLDSEPSRASVFICVDWAVLHELSRLE